MSEKVSIITVCKNSVQYIEQTILSVLNQTYQNIEYIVIDGGSTDGTVDILRKYAPRLTKWVSEPDNGIYDAYNKGISLSTGSIIGIINSSDWYAIDAVEKVANYFREYNVKWLHGDVVNITRDGIQELPKDRLRVGKITDVYDFPTVFIKREVYDVYGGFDLSYRIEADIDMMIRLKVNKVPSGYVPSILSYYRMNGISFHPSYQSKKLRELTRLFTRYAEKFSSTSMEYVQLIEARTNCIKRFMIPYITKRLKKVHFDKEYATRILRENGKKNFIIWGVGNDLKYILPMLQDIGELFRGFTYTSLSEKNSTLHGKPLIFHHELNKLDFIIVSSSRFYFEIRDRLKSNGLKEGTDFIYREDYSRNLYRDYMRKLLGKTTKNCDYYA